MKSLFSLEQYTKIFPRLKIKQKLSKSSQYGRKLTETRKLRFFYGKTSQKYLQTLYKKNYSPSQSSLFYFRLLESRLDVVLYRAHFFQSIAAAKQQIHLGKIEVNNKKVVSPGYNVLPGDIIRVLPHCEQATQSLEQVFSTYAVSSRNKKEPGLFTKKSKKKEGWRFQRSPFLLSFFVKQLKKSMSALSGAKSFTSSMQSEQEIGDNLIKKFRRKAIGNNVLFRLSKLSFKEFSKANLLKAWCFQNSFLFSFLSCLRKAQQQKSVKQSLIKIGLRIKEQSQSKPLSRAFVFQNNNELIKEEALKINVNKLKQTFPSFPLAELRTFLSDNQITKNQEKLSNLESTILLNNSKKPIDITNWLFINFVLFLKKQTISAKNKSFCFSSQKNQLFFKDQSFFVAKKVKPLHLEISYRSRSIIFLFPPQRVCLPNFIDLSQIYK